MQSFVQLCLNGRFSVKLVVFGVIVSVKTFFSGNLAIIILHKKRPHFKEGGLQAKKDAMCPSAIVYYRFILRSAHASTVEKIMKEVTGQTGIHLMTAGSE